MSRLWEAHAERYGAGMNQRAERHLVLYDADCPLCTFQMKLLTWLDWFNVLELVPLDAPQATARAPHLTREELIEAIHCVTPEGRVYRGARALRFTGMRLPLMVPIALFLYLPGVIWVAEKVYQWVSHRRHWLSRLFGCKDACSLLPSRRSHAADPKLPR